jgi:hypothetical protein
VLLTAPLPFAIAGAACGGTSTADQSGSGGTGAAGTKGTSGGAGFSDSGGSGVAGSAGGSVGVGGSSAGSVGVAGSIGTGGASGGSAGVGGGDGGGGSAAGSAGVAGSSAGGSAGTSSCMGTMPGLCGAGPVIVPASCVDPTMANAGASLPLATCEVICGVHPALTCSVGAVGAGSVTVDCVAGCVTGRRPAGICAPLLFETHGPGSYFAELARLESASVDAFRILRDELRAHGAPKKLVRAAARAARDEVRHTHATAALARRFGARTRGNAIERGTVRSIEAIALENAVEGCVRETYGALLATWQAQAARDPVVRAAMTRIARDEIKHAALSWSIGRWLEQRLDREARDKVDRARQVAVAEILRSSAIAAPTFSDVVGLPGPATASRLAAEMQRALWS